MYQIKLIAHKEITENELNEVVRIKSAQWHYSYDEQLQWIKKNIKDLDIHVLLSLDGRNVAYLNLIDIDLFVEEIAVKGFGIGNVCAIEKGKGFGFELMKEVNETIIRLNKVGLLFCKEPLLKFYRSLGWKDLASEEYKINGDKLEVMIYNVNYDNKILIEYDGILF
ncbi:hypothetical protein I5515_13775 [Acinetobacter calcoaceticus]|uniref:hypothetical protein n=1 Tax=Acinetobacter calcoaceticus TaxID=471 RepID=UPI00190026BA|nr:hypothetical protein [Acinetobacter calcoaceticus]MBJ9722867.1 hypothetical protein [Acinetobacter calcoaceticus]